MEDFISLILIPSVWAIAVLEVALLVIMIIRYIKTKSVVTLITACITFGLAFDAFFIALGAFVNPDRFPVMSKMRFVLHGLLIPLLFIIFSKALNLKKIWIYVTHGISLTLMIVGVVGALTTILGPAVVQTPLGNLIRYKSQMPDGAWQDTYSIMMSVFSIVPVIVAGVIVMIKEKNPHLFLGSLLMYISAAASAGGAYGFFISMFGEILMVFFFLLYAIKKEKKTV